MSDYRRFSECGVIVYRVEGGHAVRKVSVPDSAQSIAESVFSTLEEAESHAESLLPGEKPLWKAIIRYDRGLGVEYLTVPGIRSDNEREAEEMALESSGLLSDPKAKVAEVKMRRQF